MIEARVSAARLGSSDTKGSKSLRKIHVISNRAIPVRKNDFATFKSKSTPKLGRSLDVLDGKSLARHQINRRHLGNILD